MKESARGEVGREKEELVLKFREVMSVVEAYNKKHDMGAMIASAFAGEDEAQILEEGRRNALSDAIQVREAVSGFGLELGFGSNINISMFKAIESGDNEVVHPPEISIGIENPDLFVDFLRRIEKVDFEKYPKLKDGILQIIKSVSGQIYSQKYPEEKLVSLNTGGGKVLSEFSRLGLEGKTEFLANSLMNIKRDTLNEFLSLKKAQCFEAAGEPTFGPSQWQIDIGSDSYRSKWEDTMVVVLKALENKNADSLAFDAVKNLVACADYAIKDMEATMEGTKIYSRPETGDIYRRLFADLIPICEEYRIKYLDLLSKIKEPEVN